MCRMYEYMYVSMMTARCKKLKKDREYLGTASENYMPLLDF